MTENKKTVKKKSLAKPKTKALSKSVPDTPEAQVMNALTESIGSGQLQPDQLSMVLDAQERVLDRQARMQYMADMASCQAELGVVIKSEFNPQTKSYYEDINSLNKKIKPVYTRWGFAVMFNSMKTLEDKEGWIAMEATVIHRAGHSTEHFIELPVDNAGIKGNVNKTPVHGISSSRSYARRYLLREIFNVTTSEDHDADGNQDNFDDAVILLNEDQMKNISDLIKKAGSTEKDFLLAAKYDSIAHIPESRYKAAVAMLERRIESLK